MSLSTASANLPKPIRQALVGLETLDASLFVTSFAYHATFIDEGRYYTSQEQIQAWFEQGPEFHNATIDVLSMKTTGATTWIHIMMDGEFKDDYGITDPFPLYLYFTVDEGGEKNQCLRISQIAPTESTMRAVWAASGNQVNYLASLRCDLWKIPDTPNGWVRVKVAAVSLNYHDIFTLRGLGMHDIKFPLILGNEATGILDDGTEVIVYPVMGNPQYHGDATLDPDRHVLGELSQGSLAEYVIIPERNVVRKPHNMSFQTASVLGIAWLTAYRMLFGRSGLEKGQTMLVQGSTGGVATALIQLGRAAGMRVWSTGRTEEKRKFALEIGAHRSFAANEKLPEKVSAVFDMSGEKTFKHSMECLATGGTLVCCGLHSGSSFAEVDLMKLFTQSISVHGVYAGSRDDFEGLVRFVSENKIVPYIDTVLTLEKVSVGLQMMLEGQVRGKIVVEM